jgi:amino acid adenylation domain-containing protein
LRIDGSCRVLQFAAHTFDASLVEILTPLMVGGCVCIPDETERLNDLAGAINRLGVNHAVLTPSFVGFLSPSAVPGLRKLVLAGEAMAPSHVATWSHINLVNGYGPAESSVAAVVNSHVGPDTEATDIGTPCGVRCWLVDPADHNRLVPVGCVGELLLEGPSLARGYLNDPAKTEESFIFDPAWADATGAAGRRRFYKTGDLARYNSGTGSLSYVGRKDTQIKLHGQRIELGEIEHHLAVDASVKHAMILLPKLGPLEKRLVAVLSLDELTEPMQPAATAGSNGLRLCDNISVTEPILQEIRARLTARLPAYMVPSVWLCVDAIPMLPSRKMDRKSVTTWVESVISQEECQRILMGHNSGDAKTSVKDNEEIQPLTETEATLRNIWSLVLNLPAAQISLDDRSFLSLGGDSISAMACASRAKKAQLGLTVQEVLRAKSLRQLAAGAKKFKASNEGRSAGEEETELLNVPFALSPIQQLHFQVRGEAEGDEHFNQSFCLRLGRHVDATLIRDAIETIVKRHAMLRARFERSPEDGQWRQFITPDVGRSYRFRAHSVRSAHLVDAGIADAQGCLSVRRGPIFAAELFAVEDSGQEILFMTAHHLVIDLVSWRVILEEMEELLEKQHLAPHPSLSFRSWTVLQKEHCINAPIDHSPPPPPTQFEYWGMQAQPNLYGDVICHGFSLDPTTTNTLLSSACQNSLRTEPVDLLLAALLQSFATTFSDRSPPAIFNEGHGREPPSPETTDISRTVGWFTTLFPITASFGTSTPEFTDTLIQTKDLRRRAPGNGRQFFASQFYHPSSNFDHRRADMRRMEVTFNFLGRYQQLERPGALFAPAALLAGEAHSGNGTADFGRAAPRFALVEISAVVVKDVLRFAFAWNRHMLRQDELRRWVDSCSAVLRDAARILPGVKPRFTAGDLTLLPGLKGEELVKFEREKLKPLTGDSAWEKVEDVYPASPIQEGLLMSRTKDGSFYAVRRVFKVALRGDGGEVDVRRLVQAWEGVVMHHALLRTVFVDAISEARAGSHDQLVLKRVDMESLIAVYECRGGEDDMRKMVDRMESMQYSADKPQHRLSIFHSIRARSVCCVLEMSHAIMDGASMDILLRDLARSYAGSIGNTPKPLFSPFMASLQQRNAEADIGFWTSYLAGIEPCHFPVLNDGINLPESTRELRSLRVSVPNLAALQSFCDAKGFTLPNAFHAAWGLTLACYTASDDVCFGYLVSGRDAALVEGSEDAIGPFINMVTQRVKLRGEKDDENALSLLRVLEATQKDQLDSMPHAQASLAEVQHALKMPGGMALFNTCISYRRRLLSQQSATTEALECTDLEAIHDPTEYPISLNIETSDDGEDGATTAAIDIDYWTDAVSAGQAEHVAATFVHALTNIAEHTEIPLSQLDIVHESSKSAIWAWNANLPPTTADCIHHMIAKQVSLRAQSQAVRGWDADFSYAELDRLSSSLAAHLVSLGVAPEVFVPVCFDKSAWTVVSMLAVLKAGGGVVPLDATHPADALEGKVADAGAHVVVASETRAAIFEAMVPYVVAVGPRLMAQLRPEPEQDSATVSPSDPAFVMFTSGSTGKPKGVVLCHQALVSSALAHGAALGIGPHTRFLQFAAHTFDNSLEEMFTTLIYGGCVCVPSEADRLGDLPGAIDRLDANFMDLTPTVAALLRPNDVPKICGLAVGGEALTQEVLDIWGGAIPLHNQYGPSECSINATHRLHSDARGDVANIGTSVGSVSWVVDPRDHDRLLPVGCVGELLIEGPILARGYLGRPAETAKAFIEMPKWAALDPCHDERGARRMYKTGDLVRYNSDGSLVYLGRKDTQVKLHGQRIELGEIEHHVKAFLPEGAQSSVELVTLGHSQQKMLAVFFCLSANPATTKVEILPMSADFQDLALSIAGALSVKLAAYMVPNVFFPVSQMPLTSSGKLDRRRLRTAAQALSDDGVLAYRLGARTANGRLPETAMEKELQALWASVLKVEPASIGAEDSFFRHGGDSVGAMRLVAAARQRGIVLAVATIFQTPKLADMAATITATSSERPSGLEANVQPIPGPAEPFSLVKLDKTMTVQRLRDHVAHICRVGVESVEDIYPCTPLQAGMVAASQRQPGAYVAVNSYRLPYRTDIDLFKKAWQDVVNSEAILRTRVVFIEGMGFLQVVVRGAIDWLTAPSHNDLPKTYSHLPMQDGGEISRYALIQAPHEGQQTTFVWAAHHALYDGWSLPTLLSRVEARYSRPQAPIPPVPHYSRFVEYLCNTDLSASDAFWRSKLSGPAPRHFPSLPHPGYRVQAASQLHRCVRFAKPKGSDLTTASFLRAGWALVLAIYASSDDVVFGEVLSGRDVPVAGVEDLIGPTLASVPRRIRIDRNGTVQRVLADVQAQLNDVIPHQFAGLQRIKSLGPEAAVACEFQNLLAIDMTEDMPQEGLWEELASGGNKQGADFFNYPLNVMCALKGEGEIDVCAYFDHAVVPQWQVVRMLAQFETVLQRVSDVRRQNDKVGDVDLLSQDDKALVRELNRVPGPVVKRRVQDVIADQMASRGASEEAVVGWDATLSNAELDTLSTALACELACNGMNRGNLVPFCFEKSAFAVVAMLAVLKAGAAFVPLDPAHPVSRLKEIVGDCEASVIVCSPRYSGLCSELVDVVLPVDGNSLRTIVDAQRSSTNVTEATGLFIPLNP